MDAIGRLFQHGNSIGQGFKEDPKCAASGRIRAIAVLGFGTFVFGLFAAAAAAALGLS
jgi:hypothetical protein